MKKLLLLLILLLTGCASFQVSTLNHDPIYDTVLVVSSDTQVDTLNEFQFRNKLRTDFNFRYDFAQYALTQPRSFDWNNRILGNRYNFYSPYGFGYNYYWNRDQMWNDWIWGYPFFQSHMWSSFGYDRWGYNSYGWNSWGWNNYGWNNWGWRQQMNNYAWQHRNRPNTVHINGRRGSNNIQSRVVANNTNRTRVVTTKPRIVITNKPRVVINNKPRINNSRPIFNNNSRPTFNNNSRPNRTIRTNPNNSSRSISNNPTRSNSKRNN